VQFKIRAERFGHGYTRIFTDRKKLIQDMKLSSYYLESAEKAINSMAQPIFQTSLFLLPYWTKFVILVFTIIHAIILPQDCLIYH
jgi:hypothetical protein